jgi:hypothetical protein
VKRRKNFIKKIGRGRGRVRKRENKKNVGWNRTMREKERNSERGRIF